MNIVSSDEKTKKAYENLEKMIISSNVYNGFIEQLVLKTNFVDYFIVDGNFNFESAKTCINNLDYMHLMCNEENLNIEDKFHDFSIKCIESTPLTDIEKVIYTYMFETKYGNPKRKTDFTLNDRLFYVLESIYGLDNLLLSCKKKDILYTRFNDVMQTTDIDDFTDFLNEFSKIRKDLSEIKDEEELASAFDEKKEFFRDYVSAGINRQYTEVSKDNNGDFSKVDNIYEIVRNQLGFGSAKKM